MKTNRKNQKSAWLTLADLFAVLRQKRAGINIDMETLRAYRDEGRR